MSFRIFVVCIWCSIALVGCSDDSPVKIYKYPTGEILLREEYQNGEQDKSTWYDLDGNVLKETVWKNGAGTSYQVEPEGWISTEMPFVNSWAHGTARYFDESGKVVATREFLNGEAVGEKVLVENDDSL